MKIIGKILWWDARDREGVIVDPNGKEFYFNASAFPEFSRFRSLEGRFVKFTLNEQISTIRCAKNVSVVPSGKISKAKRTFINSQGTDATVA